MPDLSPSQFADTEWHHGTTKENAYAIDDSGVRTNVRGIQVHGPGFYVTPDWETAADYAHAGDRKDPTIISGFAEAKHPVAVSHHQLVRLGAQFRTEHPHYQGSMDDVALGNIALRQRGHDFMHVTEGKYGTPTDVGVVLRPKVWTTGSIQTPRGEPA